MILDRTIGFALTVSVLWHLLWFFTVNVNVIPKGPGPKHQTKVVSLGTMLDDEIFKTLVDARPESTRAAYQALSEFRTATELPPPVVQRQSAGETMSLPGSEQLRGPLRQVIGGTKVSLNAEVSSAPTPRELPFRLTQGLSSDQILSRPDLPSPRAALLVRFVLEADGRVSSPQTVRSSGDPQTDRAYEDHVRQWVFAPEAALALGEDRSVEAEFFEGAS